MATFQKREKELKRQDKQRMKAERRAQKSAQKRKQASDQDHATASQPRTGAEEAFFDASSGGIHE